IGYYLGGSIPIRRNATGILPHRGWLSAGQWTGEVPFEERPHVFNPASGYIATANNKIVNDRYPYYISNLWEPSGRIARIHEMLSAPAVFSVDNFKRMQLDVESVVAKSLLPIILQHVEAKLDSNEKSELGTLYRLIKDWDGVETPDRIEPAIFHAFLIKFAENTLRDEMGDKLYQHYIRTNNVPFRVVTALLRKEHSVWFDDISTEKVESKTDIVVESLLDAGRLLRQMAGESIADWRWGEIHQLTMAHPLGVQKPLDFFLNIGPMQRGGSTMTINSAEYRFRAPFTSDVGPSTRQIVDLCDTAHAWSVITTGASGQRMSKHYKDQTPLWVAGDYHPMMMERAEVIKDASEHLVLSP
ncbi:penicillin acylase family protein, partial [candidate division KSB1 bacterium]|nr:penicillin acylase family protein [candidate division KSB1 bacterium]